MSRRFSPRERTELWLASDGNCAICGEKLGGDFHADHVKPWSKGGRTISENGQVTCPKCNLKKGDNMLRKHQEEFLQTCRLMKANPSLRKVINFVVPGGGKSSLPVIAAHELIPYIGDCVVWLTPRSNLRLQAEEAFTQGWLRNYLGHDNEVRAAVNEADPLRGKVGYATTYHAIVTAQSYRNNPHLALFESKRVILFLDEPNHIALEEEYDRAIRPLAERAAAVILMGGHLSRNDNKRTAFLNYVGKDDRGRYLVDLESSPTQAVIRYTLSDATKEHALININFELRDCEADWELRDEEGATIDEGKLDSFDGASSKDTSRALYTALKTDFSESLLKEGAQFWRKRRLHNARSRLIVVAPYISNAEDALGVLRKMGVNAGIATSNDTSEALANIDRFKEGKLDALVTVAMAYEGLDVPEADVLVCLTHIRSQEWIEQMIHRVTRFDRGNSLPWEHQFATIFAPKDRFFLDIMAKMKAEQAPYVKETIPGPTPPRSEEEIKLHARDSKMTNGSAVTLGDAPVEAAQHLHITGALEATGLEGMISTTQAHKLWEAMQQQLQQPVKSVETHADVEPPRKREKKLRDEIVALQRDGYQQGSPASQQRIERRGKAMWKMFRKPLPELTEDQLQAVLQHRAVWMVP